MQSTLDQLKTERGLLDEQIKQEELRIQERKELLDANRPLRYNSETNEFTARIPTPETDTGFTDYQITLSEDHLTDLLKEIPEANYDLAKLLTSIGTQEPLDDGWRRSPLDTHPYDPFTKYGPGGGLTLDQPLRAMINGEDVLTNGTDGEELKIDNFLKNIFGDILQSIEIKKAS